MTVPLTVFAAGPKGADFVSGLLDRGIVPRRLVSYPQAGDVTQAFQRLAVLASARLLPFAESRRPSLRAGELAIVVGWQFLLDEGEGIAVVFHDSLLPKYRGFAPTVTALIRGDAEIGVTALRLAEQADEGPILGQLSVAVDYPIKIERALTLQVGLMIELAIDLLDRAAHDPLTGRPQDENGASLSLWRDDEDYWIDWSEPADRICRTIDALGTPYAGARTLLGDETIVVTDASPIRLPPVAIRQPGKCWRLDEGRPVVICGDDAVRIERAVGAGGEVRFDRLRIRLRSPARQRGMG